MNTFDVKKLEELRDHALSCIDYSGEKQPPSSRPLQGDDFEIEGDYYEGAFPSPYYILTTLEDAGLKVDWSKVGISEPTRF